MAVSPPPQDKPSKVPSALELPQRLAPSLEKNPESSGEEESCILRATTAAQTLASIIRPCFGPYGRQKFLVTAKGETVCTGHAAAILRALELEHPAAQFVREVAQTQAENTGDGTAFVVLLTEALLEQAQYLLWAGLARTQIREAFATATAEVLTALPSLAIRSLGPLEDPSWALCSVMNTHMLSDIEYLTKLVAHVCWVSREPNGSFKPERIGVCTLQGGTLTDSRILPGLAISGKPCGQITEVLVDARVALFICPFGPTDSFSLATPRLSSPEELLRFLKQTDQVQKEITHLASMEINVAVVWGEVNEKMVVQADNCGIMVIQANSRKEMVYLSEMMGTPLLTRLLPPLEPGRCQKVYRQELEDGMVVVFEWEPESAPSLTVILRGPTIQGLRGAEQAVYYGIDAFYQLCQDPRLLPGAGATEMALAKMLTDKGSRLAGPNGLAFLAFAQALSTLPKTLAENAGLATQSVMAEMSGIHQVGNFLIGVGTDGIINVAQEGIWDILRAKAQGLQAVAELVQQLVSVDEIIVAKKTPPAYQQITRPTLKVKGSSPLREKIYGKYV
ncbi:T-complex protein 1 subunit theta-like 2 [Phodopus roborovskii]|uniref:Cct8l1 protein n=1 Tax=Phodopus roborovskii TaxID=109678 RepID=A0AAV0A3D8_PHORO|nr:T-complex protein 1 subunit theta-like 2 [Phodopus roborovskii]CAH7155977.1 Cct8l1 [Phodopus roborovskii]